jgi:hypothetical protein
MRYATDENFDGRILAGLRERLPDLDIVRVQDTEMHQSPDDELLAWLADEARVLLTHDVQTLVHAAYARVKEKLPMPGVIEVHHDTPIGVALDELEVVLGAGTPDDFENQVKYIPLR